MWDRLREPWSDQRAERTLGALASAVLLIIALMVIFVTAKAWPTLHHNGLRWLGSGGDVDQQISAQVNTGAKPSAAEYQIRAWPLIYASVLTTGLALVFGVIFAVFSSVFIVEFAPPRLRRIIVPVVRLLAA